MTISPFSTSLTNFAPIISRAQVSEVIIYDLFSLPITNGRIPNGSLIPIKLLLDSGNIVIYFTFVILVFFSLILFV